MKTTAERTTEAERALAESAAQRRREQRAREVEPPTRPRSTPSAEAALRRAENANRRDGSNLDPKPAKGTSR